MIIDKTHSKKDIVNLFRKHGVIINDELTKGKIVSNIEQYLKDVVYNDKIKNCTEKKIIKWAKNDYIFDMSTYCNQNDPYNDIMSIYMWGDLPSVRRACRLYNLCSYCKDNVNPIITEEVEEEMNQNKIIKQQYIYKLQIRRATKENPVIVSFD